MYALFVITAKISMVALYVLCLYAHMFVCRFLGAGLNLFEGDIKGYNPKVCACVCLYTVSHFSYEPPFEGPLFRTKMLDNLLIYTSKKYWNHSFESFCYFMCNSCQKYKCNLNVYIFYLRFALGIIHGDHCDRKTKNTINLFK